MENYIFYGITILLLLISYFKSKEKTKQALKKAWKAFENILPQFLGIITLIGIMMAILNPQVIFKLIGSNSGWIGVVVCVLIGAITLIPGFVAFPMAAMLIENGAGYMQIGAFISSLMMVGVVTMPLEMKYFGKKITILRNTLALMFSFVVAIIIGKVVG